MNPQTTKGPKFKLSRLVAERRELVDLFGKQGDLRVLLPAIFRIVCTDNCAVDAETARALKSNFTAEDVRKFMLAALDAMIEQAKRDYETAARADVEAAIAADEKLLAWGRGKGEAA